MIAARGIPLCHACNSSFTTTNIVNVMLRKIFLPFFQCHSFLQTSQLKCQQSQNQGQKPFMKENDDVTPHISLNVFLNIKLLSNSKIQNIFKSTSPTCSFYNTFLSIKEPPCPIKSLYLSLLGLCITCLLSRSLLSFCEIVCVLLSEVHYLL